jgi:hypothetical protein
MAASLSLLSEPFFPSLPLYPGPATNSPTPCLQASGMRWLWGLSNAGEGLPEGALQLWGHSTWQASPSFHGAAQSPLQLEGQALTPEPQSTYLSPKAWCFAWDSPKLV